MKFSAWPSSSSPWTQILDESLYLERTGWDGVWIADHFMPDRDDNLAPTVECWTVLAGLAAIVPRVRLGSLVTGNSYRHPGVLAKQAAQVDQISGGRVVLGIGSGWQESEHKAYDIPFYSVGERLRRLEESVEILRSLFDNQRTTFDGHYYHYHGAPLSPKPLQSRLPLLIGGGGEKVTLRIAAQHADEWNTWGTPEAIHHKIEVLERYCEQLGRDPETITRSTQVLLFIGEDANTLERARRADPARSIAGGVEEIRDAIGRYRDAGVDEFILPDFNLGRTVEERTASFDLFIEQIAPEFW